MPLVSLTAAALLSAAASAAQAAPPAQLTGQWKCTRSVVSDTSMIQPMLTFTLAPGSWTDLTWGPARAVKGKASYAGGVLKLYTVKGSLLHTLRWTPGEGGRSARLVEQLAADNKTRSGEVCYGG